MKFDSTTGGSKHGARDGAETGRARGHRSGSGDDSGCGSRERHQGKGGTDQAQVMETTEIMGNFATGVLVLELIHTVYVYIT